MHNASTSKHHTKNPILRCFCNCSSLTRKDYLKAANDNIENILKCKESSLLLNGFLLTYYKNIKPKIQEDLECYRFCEDIVDQQIEVDDDVYEQLVDYCFTQEWEERLEFAKETQDDFQEFLRQMMVQAQLRMESYPEFKIFKEKLNEKLK